MEGGYFESCLYLLLLPDLAMLFGRCGECDLCTAITDLKCTLNTLENHINNPIRLTPPWVSLGGWTYCILRRRVVFQSEARSQLGTALSKADLQMWQPEFSAAHDKLIPSGALGNEGCLGWLLRFASPTRASVKKVVYFVNRRLFKQSRSKYHYNHLSANFHGSHSRCFL